MRKTMAVKTRTTGIDQHESSIAKLAEDLTALAMAAAEHDAAMAEAMTVRRKITPWTRRHWPLLRVLLQPRLTRSLVSGGVRDVDKADCDTMLRDYPEGIDVDRPWATPEAQEGSLVQVLALKSLRLNPDSTEDAKHAFLQVPRGLKATDLEQQNPESHGYELQPSGVTNMLEKIRDEFTDVHMKKEKAEEKFANLLPPTFDGLRRGSMGTLAGVNRGHHHIRGRSLALHVSTKSLECPAYFVVSSLVPRRGNH